MDNVLAILLPNVIPDNCPCYLVTQYLLHLQYVGCIYFNWSCTSDFVFFYLTLMNMT